jgi:hypothetical protein
LSDCFIFYFRELFTELFALNGAVFNHDELTIKMSKQPNYYQFTRWWALRQINIFRNFIVTGLTR